MRLLYELFFVVAAMDDLLRFHNMTKLTLSSFPSISVFSLSYIFTKNALDLTDDAFQRHSFFHLLLHFMKNVLCDVILSNDYRFHSKYLWNPIMKISIIKLFTGGKNLSTFRTNVAHTSLWFVPPKANCIVVAVL